MTNDNNNTDTILNPNDLNQSTGTSHHYNNPAIPKNFVYTDGIKDLAETYGMYWLVSDIALLHLPRAIKKHDDWFYLVILKQLKEHEAELIITDGNDTVLYRHHYEYVNFIFDGVDADGKKITEMELFVQLGENRYCLMLPSEY